MYEVLNEGYAEQRFEQLMEKLVEGAVLKGVVKNLTDYGAWRDKDKGETVVGIAMMQQGENASAVVERVKATLDALRPELPPGIELPAIPPGLQIPAIPGITAPR